MKLNKCVGNAGVLIIGLDDVVSTGFYFDKSTDSNGSITMHMDKERLTALRDILNGFYPPIADAASLCAVKLPDEPGYYLTRQNRLLLKDEGGDWSARGLDGAPVDDFWEDEQTFTRDSAVIVSTLGVDTFPLIPVDVKRLSKAGD